MSLQHAHLLPQREPVGDERESPRSCSVGFVPCVATVYRRIIDSSSGRGIRGFRNIVVHGYVNVLDLELTWTFIEREVDGLASLAAVELRDAGS